MSFRQRVLTFGPIAVGLTIAMSLTYPAYTDWQREHEELNGKKLEYQSVMARAADKDRLDKIKNGLESDIDNLRKAIPRAPYLDLLMLDVEHMASESQVDLIGLETPEKSNTGNKPESDDVEEIMKARTEIGAVAAVTKPASVKKEEPVKAPTNPFGIKQLTRRLFITGDYDNMITFMRKLEAYQRIIAMKNLSIAVTADQEPSSNRSAAGEKAQKLKLTKPVMTFLLNVYYLP